MHTRVKSNKQGNSFAKEFPVRERRKVCTLVKEYKPVGAFLITESIRTKFGGWRVEVGSVPFTNTILTARGHYCYW